MLSISGMILFYPVLLHFPALHYLLLALLCDIRRVIHPIEQCNVSQMIAEECVNALEHCNRTINTTDSVSRQ